MPGVTAGESPMGAYTPAPAYEHLGDLPPTYGSQSVYLVAYDPRQLFAYWDVDSGLAGNASYGLRVCRADGEVESEVPIHPREAGRYLAIGVPGGTYYVELGTSGRAGRWRPVAFSGRVTMPRAGLAGEAEPRFATLPFHLSFQRLLELIHDAMGQGEDLTAALARLQAGDQAGIAALVGTLASLSREQLVTLERLLGHQVNPRSDAGGSFGGASENLALAISAGGSEVLSSAGLGGGAASAAAAAFGSETLSSQAAGSETLAVGGVAAETLPASAFGSETLSSQAFSSEQVLAAAAALTAETMITSAAAGAFGSETLAAVAAASAAGFGSETLAAGAAAAAGFGSENLSGGAALSSAGFGSETLAAGALVGAAVGSGSETSLGFGSESLASLEWSAGSLEILKGLGISSAAWALASGGAGLSSEELSSDRASAFFRSLETNLANLTSMFSDAFSTLKSEFADSESSSSFGGSGSM